MSEVHCTQANSGSRLISVKRTRIIKSGMGMVHVYRESKAKVIQVLPPERIVKYELFS